MIALVLGALAFVVIGAWMIVVGDSHRGIPTPIIGVASIAFFGAAFVYGVRSLLDSTPGLVLREDGFEDRSSGVAVGFVPWSEVRELAVMSIAGQRFLAVRVHEPAKYAARGNWWQRAAHRSNTVRCGTPIAISSNALRISFDALVRLFEVRAGMTVR